MWGLRKMHRHCFRIFTYWLQNLLKPYFLKIEGIYKFICFKNINYLKKEYFFHLVRKRRRIKCTCSNKDETLTGHKMILLTTVPFHQSQQTHEHKGRRWINDPCLAVLDERENDSITWNGSRENFIEKIGNLLLSMQFRHTGGWCWRNKMMFWSKIIVA